MTLSFTIAILLTVGAPPAPEDVARWTAELGDARYVVRERALQKLWEAGPVAEAAVRAAAVSGDPEIARRASQLVEKYDWGIYYDTPADVVTQVGRFRGGDEEARQQAIRALVRLGAPARSALGRLSRRTLDATERALLAEAVALAVRDELPKYLISRDFAGAESLLEGCLEADTSTVLDHYVAVVLMAERLAVVRPQWDERAAANTSPATDVAFALARAAGNRPAARRLAEKSQRADWRELAAWDEGDWQAVAGLGAVESPDRPHSPYHQLALQSFCGFTGDRDANPLHKLRQVAQSPNGSYDSIVAAQGLFLLERPRAGLAVLRKYGQKQFAFDVYCARGSYSAALALAEEAATDTNATRRSNLRMQTARTLSQLGEKERAGKLFDQIAGDCSAPYDGGTMAELMRTEKALGLMPAACRHAGQFLDILENSAARENNDVVAIVFGGLVTRNAEECAAWYRFWKQYQPAVTPAERVERVLSLFAIGGVPPTPDDLRAFEKTIPMEPVGQHIKGRNALAAAWVAAGQPESARKVFREVAQKHPSVSSWLKLGDFERSQRRYAEAADAYGQAAMLSPARPLPRYLQARCLREAGRADEAREVGDLAFRLSAGNFEDRATLATDLRQRDLVTEARREEQFILRAIGERASYCVMPLNRTAGDAAAAGDFARAADLAHRARGDVLRFGLQYTDHDGYLGASRRVNLLRARAALAAGDATQAVAFADVCLEMLPRDVSVPMFLSAGLTKTGRGDDAERLYRRVTGVLESALGEYPNSAMLHNDLAWCAAVCRRDLDAALRHSRRAIELSPGTSGYYDTLAELLHQKGDRDESLVAIRRAIKLDPGSAYLQSQLRRIEAGDRDSLPAEADE
ncbi:MAG: hypothetical protein K1X57_16925 [Gemmataceae bacterium]|nr:hypothetical protein [Gemmataceae bacterium]